MPLNCDDMLKDLHESRQIYDGPLKTGQPFGKVAKEEETWLKIKLALLKPAADKDSDGFSQKIHIENWNQAVIKEPLRRIGKQYFKLHVQRPISDRPIF